MRWEPFEPRSPNAGAGHSADAVKKAVSPGLECRSWRTTGSQSRESFIPGPTSVSPSGTRGKSRMHKGARTDPCGGRGVTRAPTATQLNAGKGVISAEHAVERTRKYNPSGSRQHAGRLRSALARDPGH